MIKKMIVLTSAMSLFTACGVSKSAHQQTVDAYEERLRVLENDKKELGIVKERLENDLQSANKRYSDQNEQLNKYLELLDEYERNYQEALRAASKNPPSESPVSSGTSSSAKHPAGLYYRVQLAARGQQTGFFDLSKNADIQALSIENGMVKWRVGYFKSYQDAKDAEASLRGIGVKDTMVVPFYDGERISSSRAQQLER